MVLGVLKTQRVSDTLPHRESNQGFVTFRLQVRSLSTELAAVATCYYLSNQTKVEASRYGPYTKDTT